MDPSQPDLLHDCLITVFSYLQDEDLVIVSNVCKTWQDAAETPWLWRRLCLQRWGFCNLANFLPSVEKQTWKTYYIRRALLELKMKTGRSGSDYKCQSLRGHNGKITGVLYLAGISATTESWNQSPVVCSASKDGTVRAWDVQKAAQLWSSPVQSPLSDIAVELGSNSVVTVDDTGTLKAWEGTTGQEVASFSTGSPRNTLHVCRINDDHLITVGSSNGCLHTLRSPSLAKLSRHVVFDSFYLNLILSSVDKRWIFTATMESSDLSPVVFLSQSLCQEDEGPVKVSLQGRLGGCCAAVFVPSHPARLAVIHNNYFGPDGDQDLGDGGHGRRIRTGNKILSVFDISMKKAKYDEEPSVEQVGSYELDLPGFTANIMLQARDCDTLVVAHKAQLSVFSIKGVLLHRMSDHTQPITALSVDSFRVVTASQDLSLRVLTWKHESQKGLALESQYHLLGGSHTMSRGFTFVACDYISIVGSVEAVNGKDVLKAYTFNT